jgi:hypothetical protein
MTGCLIAFAIAFVTGFGARDQVLLAQLSRAGGPRNALLVTALATAGLATALAAWVGWASALQLTALARQGLAGLALAVAGIRLLPPARPRVLKEPTNSLGAAAIVLIAYQVADTGRLSILALALAVSGSALPVACGGVLGSAAVLATGWHHAGRLLMPPAHLHLARQAFGVTLTIAGIMLTVAAGCQSLLPCG